MEEYINYAVLEARYVYANKVLICAKDASDAAKIYERILNKFDESEILKRSKAERSIHLVNGSRVKVVPPTIGATKGEFTNALIFPHDRADYGLEFIHSVLPLVADQCHRRVIGIR